MKSIVRFLMPYWKPEWFGEWVFVWLGRQWFNWMHPTKFYSWFRKSKAKSCSYPEISDNSSNKKDQVS